MLLLLQELQMQTWTEGYVGAALLEDIATIAHGGNQSTVYRFDSTATSPFRYGV